VQLHNLAAVEHAVGRLAQAESLYRQALSLKQQLLGADHPEVTLVAHHLATLLMERAARHSCEDRAARGGAYPSVPVR
jgi:hypothetical protein